MFVYITQAGDGGPVKIGFSRQLGSRMRSLESGTHEALRVLRVLEGGRETERWMHERFASSHRKGEWFDLHPDMLTVLPPDSDTLLVTERVESEEIQTLLCEMRKCILQVASDLPQEANIKARIRTAAERFALPYGRVRSFYYLIARIVSAHEADRIRLVTRSFLADYADQLELKAREIRRELSTTTLRSARSSTADVCAPDLFVNLPERR